MRKDRLLLPAMITCVALLAGGCGCSDKNVIDSSSAVNEASTGSETGTDGTEKTGENDVTTADDTAETGDGSAFTGIISNGIIDTGNLTETGNGYEGTEGTGDYNYGEALQKAILFYELQRSGDLPESTRCNWRGDSGLSDGSPVGIDLTGGLYDAGDNAKFNLPMAYTSSVLGWSVYENKDAYEESGQYEYIMDTIKWVNDYLIKCHTEDHVYYYQVGDGNIDHSWWGPSEVMQMERPCYCVTDSNPGSCVVAQASASLAICSILYRDEDASYSELCLSHAKSLFEFADSTKSDAGYTAANGFYTSNSGYMDELIWSGVWLYIATDDKTYLDKCDSYWNDETDYKWTMCWDDQTPGSALLLARLTGDSKYSTWLEKNLDYWTTGYNGEQITYTPKGLAWLDTW